MKHGRLASEVPKGFFRAVFGVPRMRASVCSVVTLQYAFPLNPLKSQVVFISCSCCLQIPQRRPGGYFFQLKQNECTQQVIG